MRPPGYEPGELPTAPLRDIRVQNQYNSNAESLLFAEAKPDFAELFLEKRCKGTAFS